MKIRFLLAGLVGAGLSLAPLVSGADEKPKSKPMSDDMRRAIDFEHYKDFASARQARREAQHPTVFYSNSDRSAERSAEESLPGKPVTDQGPPAVQREKQRQKQSPDKKQNPNQR